MTLKFIAWPRAIAFSRSSAGGQSEQPSEVNNSTNTGALEFCCAGCCTACAAIKPAASRTASTKEIRFSIEHPRCCNYTSDYGYVPAAQRLSYNQRFTRHGALMAQPVMATLAALKDSFTQLKSRMEKAVEDFR